MRTLKITSVFLAFVLLLGFAATVSAESPKTIAEKTQELKTLGLFYGTDQGDELESTFTRAQAAAIIVRVVRLDKLNKDLESPFTDVPSSHWAYNDIRSAFGNGAIKGVSATEFEPESDVTGAQFATILMRALLPDDAADIEPENVAGFLITQSAMSDTDKIAELTTKKPFLRGDMVDMLYDVYVPVHNEKLIAIEGFTLADEASVTEVEEGFLVKIALDSNPTTGYSWNYKLSGTGASNGILTYFFDQYVSPETGLPIAGAGGVQEFFFMTNKTGEAEIVMTYKRPFEPASDEDTVKTFKISVKDITGATEVVDGEVYSIQKDDVVMISLESNPTTGYSWGFEISDEEVMERYYETYVQDTAEEGMAGVGGVQTFYFKALDKGEATITLTYKRPFEEASEDDTVKVYEFKVE